MTILSFQMASAQQKTLGIPDGAYVGTTNLVSPFFEVYQGNFSTKRTLSNNTILAETTAHVLGFIPVSIAAKLKVKFIDNQNFQLFSVSETNVETYSGKGLCNQSGCAFSALVANGTLQLNETWSATAKGFKITNGTQDIFGVKSKYSLDLTK